MKLSLRKLNALQLVITEQLSDKVIGSVVIGKNDNAAEVITEASEKLVSTINKKFDLLETLFSIRKKVVKANADSGVSELLTELAENQRNSAFFKQLASTTAFTPKPEVLAKAMADLNAPSTGTTYGRNNIEVSLLSKETVENYTKALNSLRKLRQKISDKLLHLNVSTEVELDEKEVSVLTKYDIL